MHGNSSGSFSALLWALGVPSATSRELFLMLVQDGLLGVIAQKTSDQHDAVLDEVFAMHPDAHLKLKGRLHIGITRFPREHVWISEWDSLQDLRSCVHASMHLPFFCQETGLVNGEMAVDGETSMTAKRLIHGDRTLTISGAFWAGVEHFADIALPVAPHASMLPPSKAKCERLFRAGERAANKWLQKGGPQLTRKRIGTIVDLGKGASTVAFWLLRGLEHALLKPRVRSRL